MADDGFRQIQWDTRYDPHIAPVNRYVDELRLDAERGWAPYVAPLYGGIHARLLIVSRDHSQDVGKIVKELSQNGRSDLV